MESGWRFFPYPLWISQPKPVASPQQAGAAPLFEVARARGASLRLDVCHALPPQRQAGEQSSPRCRATTSGGTSARYPCRAYDREESRALPGAV